MFKHQHPYPPYIPQNTKKLIIGTLPPPRFTTGDLKPGDVDFCYGSRDGQLWQIIDIIYGLNLKYENTGHAILQRKDFLKEHKIGICDMVECADRDKIDASDAGIQNAILRPIIQLLEENPSIDTLLFTGGNSKNGPEYFFRKHIKDYPQIQLKREDESIPKVHYFKLGKRTIKTVSLTAPSGAANRAVGSMALYKKLKAENPSMNTIDFRVIQYAPHFKS
ncbi:uracil-DNA glycosylase family protein [Brumimicrobium aurantiacum]|uniref:Uracil-DNA glycosylase family protein n=1 Tax=Brumimicrobium aurantiacum TaxID=1737063 RepID=A0A3E1F247_9FLAO|nr:uracil-DNA glycosylase family protein [Brumimicrobium aurantiacum]RFC55892.1 uracil-DNA glycosylase family protein [Brumimicrobium aurantiacum]